MIPDLDGPPHPIDALLQHATWTRRLARSLVTDDALAEDVAQDVLLAMSRRPPRATEPLQPWLSTSVRNRLFNLTRERRRRQAREAAADAPEAAESAEAALARLQLHKLLVDVVGELAEPYRMVVLRRYFDGLSSTEIGAREHLAPGTVRGRLKTALELLREALDRRTGARAQWVVSLAGFADRTADADPGPHPVPSNPADGPAAPFFGAGGRVVVGASFALAVATAAFVLVVRPKAPARSVVAHVDDSPSMPSAARLPLARSFAPARPGVGGGASGRTAAGVAPPYTLVGTATVRQPLPARLLGRVQSGRVAGVVVRIVKGLPDSFPVPSGEIQLAFRRGTLGPRVQVGRIGQSIVVRNDDDVAHALRIRQGQVTLFEQTLAGGARSPAIAIPKGLETIRLEGLADPPTVASVVPADNPFHAVTGEDGRFVLSEPPPGAYTLQAEDDILGTQRVEVTVASALPSIVFAFPGQPCTLATVGRGPVGKACEVGGRVEARRLMKSLVTQAKAGGERLTCDGCHRDLDDYTLLEGARAKLDKLTASLTPTSR